jgi:hypothetical protein
MHSYGPPMGLCPPPLSLQTCDRLLSRCLTVLHSSTAPPADLLREMLAYHVETAPVAPGTEAPPSIEELLLPGGRHELIAEEGFVAGRVGGGAAEGGGG